VFPSGWNELLAKTRRRVLTPDPSAMVNDSRSDFRLEEKQVHVTSPYVGGGLAVKQLRLLYSLNKM